MHDGTNPPHPTGQATQYNLDGNLIETVHAQRFNTDPLGSRVSSPALTEGALFTDTVNSNGIAGVSPAGGALAARISYSATYYNAAGEVYQTTDYVYGVSAATGSSITSNDLLYQTVYPSSAGQPTGRVSSIYDATGNVISTTDRTFFVPPQHSSAIFAFLCALGGASRFIIHRGTSLAAGLVPARLKNGAIACQ